MPHPDISPEGNKFEPKGAFDWSLDNIFHGVEIRSPEKLAVWKGMEINTNQNQGDLEINPKYFPNIVLKAGIDSGGGIHAKDEKKDKVNFFIVGPRFNF